MLYGMNIRTIPVRPSSFDSDTLGFTCSSSLDFGFVPFLVCLPP